MSESITDARAAVRRAIAEVEKTFRVGESDVWEDLRLLRKVEDRLTRRLNDRRVAAQAAAEARP